MDAILHTLIATACIAVAFYIGVYITRREAVEEIPSLVVQKLAHDGFILIERNDDGDECLVSVEALRRKAKEEV